MAKDVHRVEYEFCQVYGAFGIETNQEELKISPKLRKIFANSNCSATFSIRPAYFAFVIRLLRFAAASFVNKPDKLRGYGAFFEKRPEYEVYDDKKNVD